MPTVLDPFSLDAPALAALLDTGRPLLPELAAARHNLDALRDNPALQRVLAAGEPLLPGIETIPQTRYTDYRLFVRTGDRRRFEAAYFARRRNLSIAALRMFLGQAELKDTVQDYLWSVCEESNWVLPAHEDRLIDLFSAETSLMLAEILMLLGDTLDSEVRARVRAEIARRVFEPYLRYGQTQWWYVGSNNWNGVCNGSIAAAFLWLEPEPARAAEAVVKALAGLKVFLATAFEADGSSTEGVGYWGYGLLNVVMLAEMLYARSGGALDLLGTERMRQIAAYPANLLLSGSHFAPFSDSHETVEFEPGIIARLARRTGVDSLLDLLAEPVTITPSLEMAAALRTGLWWDGQQRARARVGDAVMPAGGIVRLVSDTADGHTLVLAAKAGHNAENHNHNDLGSFVVHCDGETFITDPGAGLYSRFYFSDQRYDNVFANSYGHSVPRVGGRQQGTGSAYRSNLLAVQSEPPTKSVSIDLTQAYANPAPLRVVRTLSLEAGAVSLSDEFAFAGAPPEVEEAFVTWLAASAEGSSALIHGERYALRLTIEEPAGAQFRLERLEEQCRANDKPGVLSRLAFTVPPQHSGRTVVRMQLEAYDK